jgi:hypothetical protein
MILQYASRYCFIAEWGDHWGSRSLMETSAPNLFPMQWYSGSSGIPRYHVSTPHHKNSIDLNFYSALSLLIGVPGRLRPVDRLSPLLLPRKKKLTQHDS